MKAAPRPLFCVALLVAAAVPARHAFGRSNSIVAENALPGTPLPLMTDITEPASEIEGYSSEVSLVPGDVLHLHVSTSPAARYRVELYRLGWYGGAGARLVTCLPGCATDESGAPEMVPKPDASGEVRAGWPVPDRWTVPGDAVSGYYVARLLLTSGDEAGRATIVPFVVRAPPSAPPSATLVQVPVDTWEAYNSWGGKSLYDFNSTDGVPAVRVSFDRPYAWGVVGNQALSIWEIPLMRFLEREGYDVSYQTDLDTDRVPSELERHRLVIVAGHGEYWTKGIRDAFEAARQTGTNLAFMGANDGYWQVRYEDGGRTMVAYKSLSDPEPDPALKTTTFRALTPPRPECALMGVQYEGGPLAPIGDYEVNPALVASDPWFAGTGFGADSVVTNVVSGEHDQIPPGEQAPWTCGHHRVTVLFQHEGGVVERADAVRYIDYAGARIFSTGSLQFSWGLDAYRAMYVPYQTPVDPRLQQFMRNALDDLTRPALPIALTATVSGGQVRLAVKRYPDPRVRAVQIVRHEGAGTFKVGDGTAVGVCETSARTCVDPLARDGQTYRYAAVALGEWGASRPVFSAPLVVRGPRVRQRPCGFPLTVGWRPPFGLRSLGGGRSIGSAPRRGSERRPRTPHGNRLRCRA
jgi:hypothetical protein